MFDVESEAICVATQEQIGVAPGVEFARTAQGLAGAEVSGGFAGVVDQQDGAAVGALESSQVIQQRRDLAGDVLVDAMQSDKGVEDDQDRGAVGDGEFKSGPVLVAVEAKRGGGDDLDG